MKSKQIKIYPEDVKLEEIQITVLKGPDGRLYHKSDIEQARYNNCNTTKCRECGSRDAQYKKGLCSGCQYKKEKERYDSLTKTTYEYPCIIGDQYFFSPEDLEEYIEENDLDPKDLIIYGCHKRDYPHLDEGYWEEYTNEDGELPEKLQELIDDFNKKLKDVPQLWFEDCNTRFIYEPENE